MRPMQRPVPYHLDAVLGVVVLIMLLAGKLHEVRWRRRAVRVAAVVLKLAPATRHTSYFMKFSWQGSERVAEYRGGPARRRFEAGDALEVLVDPERPGAPFSSEQPEAAFASCPACEPVAEPLVSFWDVFYGCASIALIVLSITR